MDAIKVLRITRHPLQQEQRRGLEVAAQKLTGRAGEVEVIQYPHTISSAQEVLEMVLSHRPDIIEVVLPINLLAEVISTLRQRNIDIPVIRSVMERIVGEGESAPVTFQWRAYELVRNIIVETAEICRLDEIQEIETS